jgi:hypothetical protein
MAPVHSLDASILSLPARSRRLRQSSHCFSRKGKDEGTLHKRNETAANRANNLFRLSNVEEKEKFSHRARRRPLSFL